MDAGRTRTEVTDVGERSDDYLFTGLAKKPNGSRSGSDRLEGDLTGIAVPDAAGLNKHSVADDFNL